MRALIFAALLPGCCVMDSHGSFVAIAYDVHKRFPNGVCLDATPNMRECAFIGGTITAASGAGAVATAMVTLPDAASSVITIPAKVVDNTTTTPQGAAQ